jgi:putative redox protein
VSRSVSVNGGRRRYVQNILVGPHAVQSDEPVDAGGNDAGPDAYELLLAALGSCAGITVRMYAERKQWPLQGVRVDLTWVRVHAWPALLLILHQSRLLLREGNPRPELPSNAV